MEQRHGSTPEIANDALGDASRIVIAAPDYNSGSGRGLRILGFSVLADEIITVIVLEDDEIEYGVDKRLGGKRKGPPSLQRPRRRRSQ